MNKSKISILIVQVFIIIFIFLIQSYYGIKKYKKGLESKPYDNLVLEYKDSLTSEKLETLPYEFEKNKKYIHDLKLGQFCEALAHSKIGGFNHPLIFDHLYFYDIKDDSGFKIEIIFGFDNDGSSRGVNVVITYLEKNEYKGGYRGICPELTKWGEDIGMFD